MLNMTGYLLLNVDWLTNLFLNDEVFKFSYSAAEMYSIVLEVFVCACVVKATFATYLTVFSYNMLTEIEENHKGS
jgi:hypothetical protein